MEKVHHHGYSQAIMWFYVDKPIKYNTYFIMKYGFISRRKWGKKKLRLHAPVYSPVLIRKRVRAVRVFPQPPDSPESISATISILGVTGDLLSLLPECCRLVPVVVIAGN
ncbi:hypothetical protein PIB30_082377 [Stylosanthes scabra]|uniref:Uncharacterized protein n=1 Tax=Stylosanthes scabra TaxID=79078 RepID=A0ABU6ZQQ1_9FABA|nr:hypothetical protein [Stylosanthes scabra]